jgi:EAL domain-containing protein (putative c-di-GMP-specific phosphodiesterase class I)
LKESGLSFGEPLEGILAVDLGPEELRDVGGAISEELSAGELSDCKALLLEKGAEPGLRDLARMRSLGALIAEARGEWLLDILREDRITSHFQPIVHASDTGRVFAYECLLRGSDEEGSMVSPGRMFDVARSAGLLFNLDRAARLKAIEEASRFGVETNVFINFNPTSIYDPVYCLRSTVDAVGRSGITADRIVFEVTESEEIRDTGQLLDILAFYRRAGFRVALDDLGAGYSSLNLLTELRPDFVKLDMALVQGVDEDPYKATIAAKLLELAASLGVGTIAEGVETQEQWRWLLANGADYVQGYYFAKPASPPPIPAMAYEATRR